MSLEEELSTILSFLGGKVYSIFQQSKDWGTDLLISIPEILPPAQTPSCCILTVAEPTYIDLPKAAINDQ